MVFFRKVLFGLFLNEEGNYIFISFFGRLFYLLIDFYFEMLFNMEVMLVECY